MSIYIEDKNGKRRKFAGVGSEKDYIDDGIASEKMTWSSEKILDTLCPPFTETGNPITCNPVENYPLAVAVTMEPIQSGTGDPSPDNIRPISGYDEVTVNVRGKNVVDVDDIPNAIVSSSGYHFEKLLPFKPYLGATFTLSANVTCLTESYTDGWRLDLGVGNATYEYDVYNSGAYAKEQGARISVTGTVSREAAGYKNLAFRCRLQTQMPSVKFEITNIMLEVNDTPTPYEPYQTGTTAQLSFPETIYGGTVDAVTGVGSEEWAFVEFDGTENWEMNSSNIVLYNAVSASANTNPGTGYCSHFPFAYNYGGDNIFISVVTVYLGGVLSAKYDIGSWKSYLAAQASAGTPVTVCYKLATPDPFQANGNRPLSALPGTNTLYTDGNSLTVSGSTSPVSAIESFKADVQASANQAEAVANILLGGA